MFAGFNGLSDTANATGLLGTTNSGRSAIEFSAVYWR
jgi:hypothetical protein